jgi:hypothetical protein
VLVDERDLILVLLADGLLRAVILGFGSLLRVLRGGLRTSEMGRREKVSPRAHEPGLDLEGGRGRGTGERADRSENARPPRSTVDGVDDKRRNRSRRFGSPARDADCRLSRLWRGRGVPLRRREKKEMGGGWGGFGTGAMSESASGNAGRAGFWVRTHLGCHGGHGHGRHRERGRVEVDDLAAL